MKKKVSRTAIPNVQELPLLEEGNVVILEQGIKQWFRVRGDFLKAITNDPTYAGTYLMHYLKSFEGTKKNFMQAFDFDAIRYGMIHDQSKKMQERWRRNLEDARTIYADAVDYLESIGYWKTKTRQSGIRYSQKENRIWYYNSESEIEQEFIPTRDAQWSLLCQKVYDHCRQIGSSIDVQIIYSILAKKYDRPAFHSNPVRNIKWVRDTVASANRWADTHGIPPMLQCTSKTVTRLL